MSRFVKTLFWIGSCLIGAAVLIFISVPTNFSRMGTQPAGETQAQIEADDRAIEAGNRREQDFQISVALVTAGTGLVIALAGGIGYFVFRPRGKSAFEK